VLGGDQQTTAWLYMAWHVGFPLAVIAYALLRRGLPTSLPSLRRPGLAIAVGVTLVAGVVTGLTVIATAGHDLLPAIMAGHHYTDAMFGTVVTVWGLSLAALAVLVWLRPHSVLDLWLIVVMVAWLCDIGLSAALNSGRFDLGFYAGRLFGVCAASFVLLVLLLETISLYARLADSFSRERAAREGRLAELQQELIHVGRVNELGQMASALTHELNQPLTAATNYLAAAQAVMGAGDAVKAAPILDRAAQQITRTGAVIERIRQFVKKGEVARRPDDLAEAVREAVALATAGGQARGVTLQTEFDPALPPVLIDRVQIQQVVLNLVRNAIEAMANSPRRTLVVRTAAAPDMAAEVSIADTGPGLDAAVREKLFQPFVTTKASGMGVGLSICRSIIELHGGRIWIDDNRGGGTVFHFTVPCVRAAAPPVWRDDRLTAAPAHPQASQS
jgi:signal transduction histidine kinase